MEQGLNRGNNSLEGRSVKVKDEVKTGSGETVKVKDEVKTGSGETSCHSS